jgi:hypothetical protein
MTEAYTFVPVATVHGGRAEVRDDDWDAGVGIFAQRAKDRPNRLGVSRCVLERVEGLTLHVSASTPSTARRSSTSSPTCRSSGRAATSRSPRGRAS